MTKTVFFLHEADDDGSHHLSDIHVMYGERSFADLRRFIKEAQRLGIEKFSAWLPHLGTSLVGREIRRGMEGEATIKPDEGVPMTTQEELVILANGPFLNGSMPGGGPEGVEAQYAFNRYVWGRLMPTHEDIVVSAFSVSGAASKGAMICNNRYPGTTSVLVLQKVVYPKWAKKE